MIEKNDWRLTNQMDFLFQKQLLHINYRSNQADWDHDHCVFCGINIDSTTGKAYCTTDLYHWICDTCFNDFHEMFEWEVIENKE